MANQDKGQKQGASPREPGKQNQDQRPDRSAAGGSDPNRNPSQGDRAGQNPMDPNRSDRDRGIQGDRDQIDPTRQRDQDRDRTSERKMD